MAKQIKSKRLNSPQEPAKKASSSGRSAVGALLRYYRFRQDYLSIRQLADKANVSHTLLAEIERGRSQLTERMLDQLAKPLRLSEDDRAQLRAGLADPDNPMIAPGYPVGSSSLIDAERQANVAEVWAVAEDYREIDDANLLAVVASNLERGCRYVYFLSAIVQWTPLEGVLLRHLPRSTLDERVLCILTPSDVYPWFFTPSYALWHLQSQAVRGAWAFRGAANGSMHQGMQMDEDSAMDLFHHLRPIVDACKAGGTFPLHGETFRPSRRPACPKA